MNPIFKVLLKFCTTKNLFKLYILKNTTQEKTISPDNAQYNWTK